MRLEKDTGASRKYLAIKMGQVFLPAPQSNADNFAVKEITLQNGDKHQYQGLWYRSFTSKIHGVKFFDTDYGTNINVFFSGGYVLSERINSRYGMQLMEKLPAVDLSADVYVQPYDFTGEDKKRVQGVLIKQNEKKIASAFFDALKKTYPDDFPAVPKAPKNGKITSQAWVLYFSNVAMTLREKVEEWAETAPFEKENKGQAAEAVAEIANEILDEATDETGDLPF